MTDSDFSPRDFLKRRRPDEFSDTSEVRKHALPRAVLEYWLDSITTRTQEADFERFAKRLAELEICPNLVPNTGPTGGGDSLADSETYPVSARTARGWHIGEPERAASERWAFPISANKRWGRKVRSDVGKIVATGRGYARIIFISSRSIRSKDRARVEAELSKKHGVSVRILDRTWILDTVYGKDHVDIATAELRIEGFSENTAEIGPRDVDRHKQLESVERGLKKRIADGRGGFELVEQALYAAELSRAVDAPREATDGRHLRARRLAREHGSRTFVARALYQHAWTTFFWHEDPPEAHRLLNEFFEVVNGTDNPYELELLNNLINILETAARQGLYTPKKGDLKRKGDRLLGMLDLVAGRNDRPSAALHAASLASMRRLLECIYTKAPMSSEFRELKRILNAADGLLGFPLQPLTEILTELSGLPDEDPEFESLYEVLLDVSTRRTGEMEAARLLTSRGVRLQQRGSHSRAIRILGRALGLMFKHEGRHLLVGTLALMGESYRELDLHWAERATFSVATALALRDVSLYGSVQRRVIRLVRAARWAELRLGRLPQSLSWWELERLLLTASDLDVNEESVHSDAEGPPPDWLLFDMVIGILLQRVPFEKLIELEQLPAVLDRLDLGQSSLLMRHLLGDQGAESELAASGADAETFFSSWMAQPAARDLPLHPELGIDDSVTLSTCVLGATITAVADNQPLSVRVAESVLAGLESLLSIGIEDRVFPTDSAGRIRVVVSEDPSARTMTTEPGELDGRSQVIIRVPGVSPDQLTQEERQNLTDALAEAVLLVAASTYWLQPIEEVMAPWFRDDDVMTRAVSLLSSVGPLVSVFGDSYRDRLTAWTDLADPRVPLTRTEPWEPLRAPIDGDSITQTASSSEEPTGAQGDGISPDIPHSMIEARSLIRIRLWDRAKWSGVAIAEAPGDPRIPPIVALLFRDKAAAVEIFEHLRADVGDRDDADRLRLSIVRGIDRAEPHHYRVVVGTGLERDELSDSKYFVVASRIHRMTPITSHNVERLEKLFALHKSFSLVPGVLIEGSDPELLVELEIQKSHLHIRWARDIGRHDIDSVGVSTDDDPILGPTRREWPVTELLAWKRRNEDKSRT